MEAGEIGPYLAERLGGEPLERTFTTKVLATRLEHRKAPIKAALLDQRALAGLGNIYVDEALWRARVHPLRPAGELAPDEVRAVREGIKRALDAGIRWQGATLRDYRTPDGAEGSMQKEFKVYGRAGEPCDR